MALKILQITGIFHYEIFPTLSLLNTCLIYNFFSTVLFLNGYYPTNLSSLDNNLLLLSSSLLLDNFVMSISIPSVTKSLFKFQVI